ncbi:uncharacterized protein LOC106651771 [Trichogramma pretiosum]|uniref:uncharacterized protein LOC106651771 n=1 Tax=Trichogramma pretiosum TaxID=7493 RepID=UPI0006C9638A|nr:uncharacterized protein LOC106651771 [Trichogramma pretiosum]
MEINQNNSDSDSGSDSLEDSIVKKSSKCGITECASNGTSFYGTRDVDFQDTTNDNQSIKDFKFKSNGEQGTATSGVNYGNSARDDDDHRQHRMLDINGNEIKNGFSSKAKLPRKIYICDMCHMTFHNKEIIAYHINWVHNPEDNNFCDMCFKPFSKCCTCKFFNLDTLID